jgi:hypothetical protein
VFGAIPPRLGEERLCGFPIVDDWSLSFGYALEQRHIEALYFSVIK